MKNTRRNFIKHSALGLVGVAASATGTTFLSSKSNSQKINSKNLNQNGVDFEQGPMDEILLKDWEPRSSVVIPQTHIPKAKYPAIDVHSHVYGSSHENLSERVRKMDEVGLETTVILTGATGERFDRLVELFLSSYPDRFQLYCGFDRSNIHEANYPERVVAEVERCFEMGARGLGELSDKGRGFARGDVPPADADPQVLHDFNVGGQQYQDFLHADDTRLDPLWQKCAELNLPVNIHIADHPSCWTPADKHQERTPNFQRFIQYPEIVTSFESLMAIRDRTCEKHPDTTFIFCHLSNQGHDLGALGKALDKYPNMYLDMSARHYEFNRTPRAATKFLAEYPDRVMFGTDLPGVLTNHMFENYWRLLESDDEYIDGPSWWMLYGMDLSDSLLEPLYRDNAKNILSWKSV